MKMLDISNQINVLDKASQLAEINGLEALKKELISIKESLILVNEKRGHKFILSTEKYEYINKCIDFYESCLNQ